MYVYYVGTSMSLYVYVCVGRGVFIYICVGV